MSTNLRRILAHTKLSLIKKIKRLGASVGLFENAYQRIIESTPTNIGKEIPTEPELGFFLLCPPDLPGHALQETLRSLKEQSFERWRVFIILDNPDQEIPDKFFAQDLRITCIFQPLSIDTFFTQYPNIKYLARIETGDTILPGALAEIAQQLCQHPCDILYTDEDLRSARGKRISPLLKPAWSPELLLSHAYFGKITFYSKEILARPEISLFSNEHELALRAVTGASKIVHLAKVMVTSTEQQIITDKKAVLKFLEQKLPSVTIEDQKPFILVHPHPQKESLISIIICVRDKAKLTRTCLDSIVRCSRYENFELLIIDNNSQEAETFALFEEWTNKEPRFRYFKNDIAFNFSKLNNYAVTQARGDLLLFLNNDTEVITETWLTEMAGYAQQPHIGSASALLLYPDNNIQHAGVFVDRGSIRQAFQHEPLRLPGYMGRLSVPSNFSALTGACMMLRRKIFEEAGGFDENLGISYNDIDLCLKIRKLGLYNTLLPQVRLYHHESVTRGYDRSPARQQRLRQELEYLISRWPEIQDPDPYYHPWFASSGNCFDDYA